MNWKQMWQRLVFFFHAKCYEKVVYEIEFDEKRELISLSYIC